MKLIPIAEHPDAVELLWAAMGEVEPHQALSHKAVPPWENHVEWVRRAGAGLPVESGVQYDGFYIIDVAGTSVGWISLTTLHWIGIRIYRACQGKGYGPLAVKMLMEKHGPRRFVANINPANPRSRKMFEQLGFGLMQHTYTLEPT